MPSCPETLYIIDGHAQIFRAFYAIRGGLNSPITGEPTQAVFGMAGMFLKLFSTLRPHYVVMAIDSKGPTFRDAIFDQYKAQRGAPPADLEAQIPRILEITRLFGIPIFALQGAEADDIIATITRQVLADARCDNIQIRLVSKDKDLMQLLGDRVTMFDIHTDTTIDAAWLKSNKGITPAQVIDLLALTGDSVDNVPGVEGIGPKTATKLLQDFGSIQGILANLDKIKGKTRENIEKSRDVLTLCEQLVTLKSDLSLDFDLEKARVRPLDPAGLRRVFTELGFRKHVADIEALCTSQEMTSTPAPGPGRAVENSSAAGSSAGSGKSRSSDPDGFAVSLFDDPPSSGTDQTTADVMPAPTAGLSTAAQYDYRPITTQAQMRELVETLRQQPMISVDTETVGLGHASQPCGLSFAWEPGHGVYVPMLSPTPELHLSPQEVLAELRPILDDPSLPKCGHNLKYDALVFRHAGVRLLGIAFDSMIASHLIGSAAHGLDHLALTVLKHEMIPITRLIGADASRGKGKGQRTMDQVDLAQIVPYAAEDADIALRLYHDFAPKLRLMGMEELARDVEMPLIEVLVEMEFNGIKVDPAELSRQQEGLNARIAELRRQILDAAGCDFNPDSPKQLAEVLFKTLGLPVGKRTKTGPSTDIEVLEALCEDETIPPEKAVVPKLIVEYRQLTKLVGTYLENLRESISPKSGRVHASFHQAVTATGRLSSTGPNLQNIPIRTEIGRQIRKAFVAEPGNLLVSADYSQIELRILAHLSGDARLIEAFEKGLDIHTDVASQVFTVPFGDVSREQRSQAKIVNFGIIYGVSPYGLVRRIEGLDIEAAKKLIADYRARFKGIDTFLQSCIQQAMEKGYVVTMGGRRRPIPEIHSTNGATRSLGQRLAINSVVQGSAAELIKMAMVNLHRRAIRENLTMKLLLQIHDELVFESPQGEAPRHVEIIKEEMERAMKLRVPLAVETGVGKDWFEAK